MLPRLELLDEEEVEFLNEVGSLHMPKYRSLMRKIAEGKRSDRHPGRSPREASPSPAPPPTQHPRNQREGAQHRALPPRIRTDVDPAEHLEQPRRPASRDNVESSPELSSPRTDPPSLPAAASDSEEAKHQHMRLRVVLKDSETNTDVAFEKGISQREQVVAQKETDFLEKEKAFLTQEKEHFVKEGVLKAQIAELQGRLEHAEARAIKAESTVLEMSSHLVQKEKAQAAAVAASDESASALQQSQSDQQSEQEAAVAMLKASHQQEMEQLTAEKVELGTKCAQLKAAYAAMEQKLGQAEQRLQQTSASLDKSERRADGIAGELELARKTHDATASQLSGEVKRHKDRVEQADRRNAQLEQQVAELKANVETVYNKCIEKDEAAQQLKKSLAARQDDIEALRLQHGKDSERQDKLQQQQQDLYERQLQASVVQVEMEFRKEHQQSLQKFQLLQRKTQERWKEVKRVREAYQASLQREAAAKAEVVKLQAMLADDKKMLLVEDAKRADAFQAEIREERAKRKALDQRVLDEQKKYAEAAGLKAELEERTLESQRLRAELEQQRDAWTTLEDDLRAALKVKDVMLADQQRQIKELSGQSRQAEAQFSDEMADLQAQVEDLEAALDESIQKAAEEEVKSEALSARLAALEKDAPQKDEQLAELRAELEQKVSALEFLDQEMQRMRAVLENQDELFKKRMQKHLEQQREQVERVRASAEEERERQLRGWGAERGDMMHKYQVLAAEMASVAAQNAKLRTALDQERRILLVQVSAGCAACCGLLLTLSCWGRSIASGRRRRRTCGRSSRCSSSCSEKRPRLLRAT